MESFCIDEGACPENRNSEVSSSEGCSELFLDEDGSEVVRIDTSIVLISLLGIDIPVSSEGIRLHAKVPRSKTNDEVELREELRPPGLPASQEFCGHKVFQIFMVSNDVDWCSGAFKVMLPSLEGLMDGKQFLVVGIIVQLWRGEHT